MGKKISNFALWNLGLMPRMSLKTLRRCSETTLQDHDMHATLQHSTSYQRCCTINELTVTFNSLV